MYSSDLLITSLPAGYHWVGGGGGSARIETVLGTDITIHSQLIISSSNARMSVEVFKGISPFIILSNFDFFYLSLKRGNFKKGIIICVNRTPVQRNNSSPQLVFHSTHISI